jgi:hypothetical protein
MRQLINQLEAAGYFNNIPCAIRPTVIAACEASNSLLVEESGLLFDIDPENLAECGIEPYEADLQRYLTRLLCVDIIFDEIFERGAQYQIVVNKRYTFTIWDSNDVLYLDSWPFHFKRFAGAIRYLVQHLSVEPFELYVANFSNTGLLVAIPQMCVDIILRYGLERCYGSLLYKPNILYPIITDSKSV